VNARGARCGCFCRPGVVIVVWRLREVISSCPKCQGRGLIYLTGGVDKARCLSVGIDT
jgi:hypothetical protein